MSLPSLEIHVPISPMPRFLNMIRCLVASLRRFGGAYRDAPLVVTVGDDEIDTELESRLTWLEECGIEIRWLPQDRYENESWFATGLERFRYEFQSDVVLLLDADVLICDSFEDLIRQVHRDRSFAGLIAHFTPFFEEGLWQQEAAIWQQLYDRGGLGPLRRPHQYTGWSPTHRVEYVRNCRRCPLYFNFGVLCAPGELMNRIGDTLDPLLRTVDEVIETYFRCQIALSLAITKLAIPYWALPPRYNFPTDRGFDELYPDEARQVRILHLLGENELEKKALFADVRNIEAIVARLDLRGSDEIARQVLAAVVGDLADGEGQSAGR